MWRIDVTVPVERAGRDGPARAELTGRACDLAVGQFVTGVEATDDRGGRWYVPVAVVTETCDDGRVKAEVKGPFERLSGAVGRVVLPDANADGGRGGAT